VSKIQQFNHREHRGHRGGGMQGRCALPFQAWAFGSLGP
jgi:hypothetical protein